MVGDEFAGYPVAQSLSLVAARCGEQVIILRLATSQTGGLKAGPGCGDLHSGTDFLVKFNHMFIVHPDATA